MITYTDLVDAVNRTNGHRPNLSDNETVRKLSMSLEIYKMRGEFDGTIQSARECLELAGYEFSEKKGDV